MLFRTGLVTLLLGLMVMLALLSGQPLSLGTVQAQSLFAVVVAAYASSLLYAVLARRGRPRRGFFIILLGLDALLVSAVVHLTGGINSVWTFLYPLLIVEAAIVDLRRGALWSTALVALAFVFTTLGGYWQLLPVVSDQESLPWRVSADVLGRSLLLNLAAQLGIAVLSAFLGGQLRQADTRVAQQQETIRDYVRLNESILNSLQSGLITLDNAGRVLSANPAALRLFGPSLREASSLELGKLLPGLVASSDESPAPYRFQTTLEPSGQARDNSAEAEAEAVDSSLPCCSLPSSASRSMPRRSLQRPRSLRCSRVTTSR